MHITNYFKILNDLELLIKENEDLRRRLVRIVNDDECPTPEKSPKISKMLQILLESAKKNAGRKTGGERYDDVIRELGQTFYHIGGLQNYELMCHNLPLPSVSTIRRLISKKDPVLEGVFRIKLLKKFLTERNFPLKVHLSEDATVISQRVQYHHDSNQVVGLTLPLDKNGLPVSGSYPATSAKLIADYFKDGEKSKYVYAIVAQPLAPRAPCFVLCQFGTNNKFKAFNVHQRIQWTKNALAEEDIECVGFSSDGDGRLMRCMIFYSISAPGNSWPWFFSKKIVPFFSVQDHIHLATKFKSRFLKPSIILPMGSHHLVSRGHLIELLEHHNLRSQHQLCISDINPKDKMNYKAMQRMCSQTVSDLLVKYVEGSEATALYLDMMREILESYTSVVLTPMERLQKLWKWVFFLRFWREYILITDGYTLENNFVTLNAYQCAELNANAMIHSIIKFRDSEEPHLFLPWLFSSQPCEATFRKLRASAMSFSILEMLNMTRRIDVLSDSKLHLEEVLYMPRHHKAPKINEENAHIAVCLPEDYEIERAAKCALDEASNLAVKFGLFKKSSPSSCGFPSCGVRLVSQTDMLDAENENENNDEDSDQNLLLIDEDDAAGNDENPDEINDLPDVVEDLLMISSGSLGLKKCTYGNVTETSPFVTVLDGDGNKTVVRKTTLCWLYNSGDTKISGDRLKRVSTDYSSVSNNLIYRQEVSLPSREESVSISDWCAFIEDGAIVIGRILAFSYLTGTSLKNREFSGSKAPTVAPEKNARGLGCLCNWFRVQSNQTLTPVSMDIHGYYDLKYYVCNIPRPRVTNQHHKMKLKLPCTLRDIKKFI